MRTPSPRQLEYFLTIAETMSFSRAAELCHVTQAGLSKGMTEFEDMIGEKLFDRGTRRVTLTRAGEALVGPAKEILERLGNLEHLVTAQKEPLTGNLSLGIIPTIAPYILHKIVSELRWKFPKLKLQIKEDLTARQLENLRKGRIDAVLMAFPYDTPDFEREILWAEPIFLATHKPGNIMEFLKIDDIKDETILLLEDGHCLRDHVIESCRLSTVDDATGLRKTLGATSLQTLIQMVQHGYGATLLPLMAIDPYNLPKGVHIRRFEKPQPQRLIGLCWRKGDPRREEFILLGDSIEKRCSGYDGGRK